MTKYPETVNWEDELDNSTTANNLASFEKHLTLLKEFGAQPVLNFKTKLFKNELKRRIYWRHVFLMNYYLNKIKSYRLPPSLDDSIPEDHKVRNISEVVEQIDLSPIQDKYQGGGCSAFDPEMMMKIIVYAYSQRIYSSRGGLLENY